jgi:tol-pal system protein YbgF
MTRHARDHRIRVVTATTTSHQQGRVIVCHTSLQHRLDDEPDDAEPAPADAARRDGGPSLGGRTTTSVWLVASLVATVVIGTGCASMTKQKRAEDQTPSKVEKLKSRVQELERQNGRLTTRIDQLEDDIFLLQDRVEAHRLALKRQRQQPQRRSRQARRSRQSNSQSRNGSGAERPQQPPSTNYQPRRRQSRRNVTRIQLNRNQSGMGPAPRRRQPRDQSRSGSEPSRTPADSQSINDRPNRRQSSSSRQDSPENASSTDGDSKETIVITNEDFDQYADAASDDTQTQRSSSGATQSSDESGTAQPDVTNERLETTGGDEQANTSSPSRSPDSSPKGTSPVQDDAKLAGKKGLDLYKASLSLYRQGDYARSRAGFKQFMKGGPRRDYQDNGLYWLGESEFGLGRYDKAISLFKRVIDEHPDGNKVPDAMLKMALAYRELGNEQRATRLLKKVASQYPRTNVGDLAERKMK